jgi:hypothetical protein
VLIADSNGVLEEGDQYRAALRSRLDDKPAASAIDLDQRRVTLSEPPDAPTHAGAAAVEHSRNVCLTHRAIPSVRRRQHVYIQAIDAVHHAL